MGVKNSLANLETIEAIFVCLILDGEGLDEMGSIHIRVEVPEKVP